MQIILKQINKIKQMSEVKNRKGINGEKCFDQES